MRHKKVGFGLALLVLLLSAVLGATVWAGGASAAGSQPPITSTEVSRFSESFSDEPFLCQDELYIQTVSGHVVVHFTFFEETGRCTSTRTDTAKS